MDDPIQEQSDRGAMFLLRAILLVLVVPGLLVVAYGAFSLQGHREDYPSTPIQSWPIGVTSLALAAALTWVALRPSRELQPALVVIALLLFAASWVSFLA